MKDQDLTDEQRANRLLVVLYKLAKGKTGVPVDMLEAAREYSRLRFDFLTDDEFEKERERIVSEVRGARS